MDSFYPEYIEVHFNSNYYFEFTSQDPELYDLQWKHTAPRYLSESMH